MAVAAVAALALVAAAGAAAPPGAAPALTTFGGLDSRQLEGVNPADVQVAAGPTAVVQTVNSSIGIWTTAGQPLRNQTLAAFFSGGGVDRSQDTMTDPRVLWDPQSGRFFGAVFDVSRIELVIGFSLTADPLGPWSVYSLPSSGCPDQPRLGTSDTLVVISDDLFSSCRGRGRFLGGEVNVLNKQDLLAGAAAPRRTSFGPDVRFAAITPAVSLTPTPVAYLSAVSSTGDGIQLIGIDTATVSSLPFRTVRLASALSGADQVPQRGGFQPLDAGDERIQNAVFDNGRLWLTASESCAGNRACGRVIGIDTANARLLQESSVSLPADRSLIYPAVAPDSRGNLVVGFVFSSTADFAGLGYTYVRPDGVVAPPRDLVAGTAANTSGRFGDYSGAARDPSDPSKIWLGAEIGQAPDGTSLGWGTGISAVRVPPQAPAVAVTKDRRAGRQRRGLPGGCRDRLPRRVRPDDGVRIAHRRRDRCRDRPFAGRDGADPKPRPGRHLPRARRRDERERYERGRRRHVQDAARQASGRIPRARGDEARRRGDAARARQRRRLGHVGRLRVRPDPRLRRPYGGPPRRRRLGAHGRLDPGQARGGTADPLPRRRHEREGQGRRGRPRCPRLSHRSSQPSILLDGVGLGERAGHLPAQLSGGEQQPRRIALRAGRVAEPQLV